MQPGRLCAILPPPLRCAHLNCVGDVCVPHRVQCTPHKPGLGNVFCPASCSYTPATPSALRRGNVRYSPPHSSAHTCPLHADSSRLRRIHNQSSASFPISSIQTNRTWPRHCLQLDWRCCCAQVSSAGAPVTRCRLGSRGWQVTATAGWISRRCEAAQKAVAAADSSHSKPRQSQLAQAPCSRMRVHCISPCCRYRAGCWCQVRVLADVWKALKWQLLD